MVESTCPVHFLPAAAEDQQGRVPPPLARLRKDPGDIVGTSRPLQPVQQQDPWAVRSDLHMYQIEKITVGGLDPLIVSR